MLALPLFVAIISYIFLHIFPFALGDCLEDALQQLYILDAIDEDGSITSLGKRMSGTHALACFTIITLGLMNCLFSCNTVKKILNKQYLLFSEFPLDPSLARVLLAAEDAGCLDQALTIASMLSCESIFSSFIK